MKKRIVFIHKGVIEKSINLKKRLKFPFRFPIRKQMDFFHVLAVILTLFKEELWA